MILLNQNTCKLLCLPIRRNKLLYPAHTTQQATVLPSQATVVTKNAHLPEDSIKIQALAIVDFVKSQGIFPGSIKFQLAQDSKLKDAFFYELEKALNETDNNSVQMNNLYSTISEITAFKEGAQTFTVTSQSPVIKEISPLSEQPKEKVVVQVQDELLSTMVFLARVEGVLPDDFKAQLQSDSILKNQFVSAAEEAFYAIQDPQDPQVVTLGIVLSEISEY